MFQIKLLLCNVVLWLSFLPEATRYIIALIFPKRAQKKVLMQILNKMNMSESEFGNRPVTKYDDYTEQIETLKETGVHPTYHEEVVRLCPTSGTSGMNKLVPYTKSLKFAFQKGLYPWIFFMYLRFPSLFFKRQYWSVTPVIQTKNDNATSKIKIGFEDDEEYVGRLQQLITKTIWVNTKEIAEGSGDVQMFLAKLAKQLSHERNLGLISVWSPSLTSLLVKKYGSVLPNNLVLSSWAHGYSEEDAVRIAVTTGLQHLQPKGLLSTEACITIPIGTQTFLFSYNSHYFEFRNTSSGKLETVTTLDVGNEYEVIVTTQSGFIRYATGDILRVTKKVFGKPSCIFVRRLDVVDLFGEKLDEITVEKVVGELLSETKAENAFWFLSPTKGLDGAVAYTLFIASSVNKTLGTKLDTLLRGAYHYNYCRELGQLGEAGIFVIEDFSPEVRFIEMSSQESGARLGDIKMKRLSGRFGWNEKFSGYFI